MKGEKAVCQSVTLPTNTAEQMKDSAEKRGLQKFFALAERFRNEPDPEVAARLGDELGRMLFRA